MEINTIYQRYIKRAGDFIVSLFSLFIFSPVFLLVALALKAQHQPIFFKHTRPGIYGEEFEVYKFTSMIEGDPTISFPFGSFLRMTSIDELPQLLNVFKGEMSIVGPRPLLSSYMNGYTQRQKRRHMVRPGITGWAQINGRNSLSLAEKIELDLFYVDNQGLLLDLKILMQTIYQLFRWNESDYHRYNHKSKEITKVG